MTQDEYDSMFLLLFMDRQSRTRNGERGTKSRGSHRNSKRSL
jgi:hypothetical protein